MIPAHGIARRFDRAAVTYETATPVQRQVARALAKRIGALGLAPGGRVAEFGCGVGYLTQDLLPALQPALWAATDVAPAMVAMTRRRLTAPALALAVMDAVRPALAGGFDLVCSSLMLQWLEDPARVVGIWRALARPGGCLALSTLTEGSFVEWRRALAAAGVDEPEPAFLSLDALRACFGPGARIETLTVRDAHASGLAFTRAARAAGIDAGRGRPLDAGAMRRALGAFDAGGAAITYQVALVVERV